MDKFHQASSEAWKHAKEQTGLDGKEISRAAGWIFRNGLMTGRFTQMEWFVLKGMRFPSLDSLLRIAILYPRFVALYLESVVFMAQSDLEPLGEYFVGSETETQETETK